MSLYQKYNAKKSEKIIQFLYRKLRGGKFALGRCSGEMLWALGTCSGEVMLLWALGTCSGEVMLLWGSNFALGRECCSGGGNFALGRQFCSGVELLWGVESCSELKMECVKIRKNQLYYVVLRKNAWTSFALGRITCEFALGKICSGEKKIGKKGENFTNFQKNWRDFGKIRGNFRRFCSEKKAIWKAIGRIFW